MASMLNAGGAKLWNVANTISGATLAGRFSEALLKDLESIGPGNTVCHVFPRGDEYPNHWHHPRFFGYPLSRSSCPRETQLIVKLCDGLLSRMATNGTLPFIEFKYYVYDLTKNRASNVGVLSSIILAI
jgi:hypothetical protein